MLGFVSEFNAALSLQGTKRKGYHWRQLAGLKLQPLPWCRWLQMKNSCCWAENIENCCIEQRILVDLPLCVRLMTPGEG